MTRGARAYFERVAQLLTAIEITEAGGAPLSLDAGSERAVELMLAVAGNGGKVILVGNGGSASIAGHMQLDLCNRAGLRAQVFHDLPVLTALSNDHGYPSAFARTVALWAESQDCLVAISSSGSSENIHHAVRAARDRGCPVITFSGFRGDNALRSLGTCNFYVASESYGEVEVAHHALGHFLTDRAAEVAAARLSGN